MRKILLSVLLCVLGYAAGATCTAGFSWTPAQNAANPLRVLFNSTATWTGSAPAVYAYTTYRFGDGSSTSGFGMYHNYPTPGTYTVVQILTTIDSVSQTVICTDSTIHQVTIGYLPCSSYFTSTITGSSTANFTAHNYANTPGATFTWQFGDGTVGSGSPVSHTYAANGTYYVKLITNVSGNCVDTAYQYITISNAPGTCSGHNANFTSYISGNTVNFYDISPSFSAQLMSHSWYFGDGSSSTAVSPVHIYPTAGTYQITEVVLWHDSASNNIVCQDTAYSTIQISQPISCSAHHAAFTDFVSGGNTVYFYNSSTAFAGQTIHSSWTFGDGGYSSLANPTHTYAAAGTYSVHLTVNWTDSATNAQLCYDSVFHSVTIANPNIIRGYVIGDSLSGSLDSFKVWLIVHDSVNGTLTAIDSTYTTGTWYAYYQFTNKPANTYLIKAAAYSQPVGSNGYVPTYYDSSIYWNQAINAYHSGGTSGYFYIYMRHGIVTSGPGFIGGNISAGANKGTSGGIEDVLVFLEDQNGKLIASTYTDINGDYSFSNIPLGIYTLYPEMMNYITTPINGVQLTAGNTSSTDNNFGQNQTEIKPKTTGIITLPSGSYLAYPNPASTKVYIRWANAPSQAQITITDVAGHKVYETSVKNASAVTDINVAQLQTGMYFMHIKTEAGEHTDKLVIQH